MTFKSFITIDESGDLKHLDVTVYYNYEPAIPHERADMIEIYSVMETLPGCVGGKEWVEQLSESDLERLEARGWECWRAGKEVFNAIGKMNEDSQ